MDAMRARHVTLRFLAFLPDQATSVCLCFPLKNWCRVFESAKHGNATNFSYFYCQSTLKQFTTHNKKKYPQRHIWINAWKCLFFCVYNVNNVWEVLFMLSLNFCFCISYLKFYGINTSEETFSIFNSCKCSECCKLWTIVKQCQHNSDFHLRVFIFSSLSKLFRFYSGEYKINVGESGAKWHC